MTIRFVDIQRIGNLIFPYLKIIEVITNVDKKRLLVYINLQAASLTKKGNPPKIKPLLKTLFLIIHYY